MIRTFFAWKGLLDKTYAYWATLGIYRPKIFIWLEAIKLTFFGM